MLVPPDPIVLVCDDADAAAAIRDMLDARAILLEHADVTRTAELPETRQLAPAIITGTRAAEVLERLGSTPAGLSALGVEVRVATANPTTFDSETVQAVRMRGSARLQESEPGYACAALMASCERMMLRILLARNAMVEHRGVSARGVDRGSQNPRDLGRVW